MVMTMVVMAMVVVVMMRHRLMQVYHHRPTAPRGPTPPTEGSLTLTSTGRLFAWALQCSVWSGCHRRWPLGGARRRGPLQRGLHRHL